MTNIITLTGGIGSGKTVASDHFATLGVPIIDTDIIAREIVKKDSPALAELADTFGNEILLDDGTLNREALGKIAFSSKQNKQKLDAITHPVIQQKTKDYVAAVTEPYCIVVIPLLTKDSPFMEFTNRVVVVTAIKETKIERIKKRSKISEEQINRIMQNQITDEERLELANDVIHNDTTIKAVHKQVEDLHKSYLAL